MGHYYPEVWGHKPSIELTKDENGIEQVVLRNSRGASARINLVGGQVISWKNDRGEEQLFSSRKATLKPLKAMRGGIMICFPKLGNSSLEQNGFANNKTWTIEDDPPPLHPNVPHGSSFIDLLLKSVEDDFKNWPHQVFEFRLRVSLAVDGNLTLTSRIRNINRRPFRFQFAYHTHLSVSDISEVRIEGLETLDYLDNLCQRQLFTEQGDAITFESEIDRIYLGSPNCIAVLDHDRKRTYVIRKEGLPDVVVWNPWEKKSKAMADFGSEDYKTMLCVDGAAVDKHITLKPREQWMCSMELAAIPSSFCTDNLDPKLLCF